jgi:hypothetical protein
MNTHPRLCIRQILLFRHSSLATTFVVKDCDGRLLAFGANL